MKEPFTGEYELSLDDKRRLMIPREIRDLLEPAVDGDGLYVVLSPDRRLYLYTKTRFAELSTRRQQDPRNLDPQLDDGERTMFALSSPVKVDSVGRITVTEKQAKRSGLGKEITLLGNGDHLEIWNREDWEQESERLLTERQRRYQAAREAARNASSPAPVTTSGVPAQSASDAKL